MKTRLFPQNNTQLFWMISDNIYRGEFYGVQVMKSKSIICLSVVTLFVTAFFLSGCDGNKGFIPQNNSWMNGGGVNASEVSPMSAYECLNMVDYQGYVYSAPVANEEEVTETGIDVVETLPKMSTAALTIATPKMAADFTEKVKKENVSPESEAVRLCAEETLNTALETGSSFYWGNRTYILIREEGVSKAPAKNSVTINDITSCEQIKAATCLVYSFQKKDYS